MQKKFIFSLILIFILLGSIFGFRHIISTNIANLALSVDTFEQKEFFYKLSLGFSDKNAKTRTLLTDLYIENNNISSALQTINDGLLVNPSDYQLYFLKTRLYLSLNQIENAVNVISASKKDEIYNALNIQISSPIFSIDSGKYDYSLNLSLFADSNCHIYYKVNTENFKKYTDKISLLDGYHTITAVSIDENGLVSDFIKNTYEVYNLAQTVSFTNDNIKIEIEQQIEDTSSIRENLLDLHELELGVLFDIDIESLSNCENLEKLTIDDMSNVTDITPLKNLKNLEYIYIKNECSQDVFADLMQIPSLKEVKITNSKISSLPANSSLVKTLILKNCLIVDIDNISTYKTLKYLDLSHNMITNIYKLNELKNLSYLNLSYNKISDILAISNIISLKNLDLSHNKLQNINELSKLAFLEQINISNNEIYSISCFYNFRYLTSLNCSFNNISTLDVLSTSQSLEYIYASYNFIDSFSYLNDIPTLIFMDIDNNISA